jgi:signal peptidase I
VPKKVVMKIPSSLSTFGAIVAFLLALIGILSAKEQLIVGLFSLVPLAAGIGILRRRAWSAYGFALFELGQVVVTPLVLSRIGSVSGRQIAVSVGLGIVLVVLFFVAGRSLSNNGGRPGIAWPWITATCLLSLPLFFVQAFVVPSGGMESTLLSGDRILARVSPKLKPGFGDIVVFHYPIDPHQVLIKRVVGLPGDRLHIVSGVVYRNGVALAEPYALHKSSDTHSFGDNFPSSSVPAALAPGSREMRSLTDMLVKHVSDGEVVVPTGEYFVLGDSRDNSLDSRYWGFLDASQVIGKAVFIYDSEQIESATLSSRRKVRWKRLFKFL